MTQVTHQLFKGYYFKSFIILKKLKGALAKNIYLKLAPNGSRLCLVRDYGNGIINLKINYNGKRKFE
jgi:hypothetical protein